MMIEITIANPGLRRNCENMVLPESGSLSALSYREALAIPRGISGFRKPAPIDDTRIPPCRRREPVGLEEGSQGQDGGQDR